MESSTAMVIAELTQAQELAENLRAHLHSSQIELCRSLAGEIVVSVEKAISAAKACSAAEAHLAFSNVRDNHVQKEQKMPKKRKLMQNWTNQVRVSTEEGSEMPNDGHSWRKYGQKDILGAKYPRAYYRCTHRKTQGCSAMKQVQKLDENPSVLDITYLGNHTCSNSYHHYKSQSHILDQNHRLFDQDNSLILHFDFQNSIECSDLEHQSSFPSLSFPSTVGADNDLFCSSAILSPTTSGSNCFALPPSDPELDEIISLAMSAAELPVMDVDFMLEYGYADADIHFDTSIFFD